ncbi:MAG: hypothetical protein PHD29_01045 [bacterium]|nr:hypothetical protein [bacterium]MDD5757263.1 hypothetical protein [bacterium]
MTFIKNLQIYGSIIKATLQSWRKYPELFKPFLCLMLLEILGLALLYYSPQQPVSLLLGPPIRAFYGEAALHYPYNLAMLPRIFSRWQLFTILFFDCLFTGIAISMYNQKSKNKSMRFGKNFKIAVNRYWPLLGYSIAVTLPLYLAGYILKILIEDKLIAGQGYLLGMGQFKWSMSMLVFNLCIQVFWQTLLIYIPIVIIIENKGFRDAALESLRLVRNYLLVSVLLVALALAPFGVVNELFKIFNLRLMDKFTPEITILIIVLIILIKFFMNSMITISTTILFLSEKEKIADENRSST